MKTFYKAAVATSLLASSMAIAMPANALTFNFSYIFESGSELSGVLEGENISGSDDVTISAITSSFFDGVDLGSKEVINASYVFNNFAGTPGNITTSDFLACNNVTTFDCGTTAFAVFDGEIYYDFTNPEIPLIKETFDPNRLSLSQLNIPTPPPSATNVPTPAAILPVLTGLFGAASKRKQKNES